MAKEKKKKDTQFAVIGLGRFGMGVLQTLSQYNVNLLACDQDSAVLHDAAEYATHIVQADVSDENALTRLGLGNYDVVILAMGEDFEASIMAAMIAKEQGAGFIIAKARNYRQKKILENIGVDQAVLPEYEMGVKIARKLMGSNILDVLEESEHYTITELYPNEEWIGKTLQEADIRKKHALTVLGVRRGGKLTIPAPSDKIIAKDDILITLSEHKPLH